MAGNEDDGNGEVSGGQTLLQFETIKGDGFEISPARYAKGKVLVRITKSNGDFMNRTGRVADIIGGGGRGYSNREKGYVMSPSQAEKFQRAVIEGWDASVITRELRPPEKLAA